MSAGYFVHHTNLSKNILPDMVVQREWRKGSINFVVTCREGCEGWQHNFCEVGDSISPRAQGVRKRRVPSASFGFAPHFRPFLGTHVSSW